MFFFPTDLKVKLTKRIKSYKENSYSLGSLAEDSFGELIRYINLTGRARIKGFKLPCGSVGDIINKTDYILIIESKDVVFTQIKFNGGMKMTAPIIDADTLRALGDIKPRAKVINIIDLESIAADDLLRALLSRELISNV